jgi:oligoribonuclease
MDEVDHLVAAYVKKHFPDGMALLAGNSVHADRAFINKDLPTLAPLLHYRHLDVSTIKELASRWYPGLRLPPKAESAHR